MFLSKGTSRDGIPLPPPEPTIKGSTHADRHSSCHSRPCGAVPLLPFPPLRFRFRRVRLRLLRRLFLHEEGRLSLAGVRAAVRSRQKELTFSVAFSFSAPSSGALFCVQTRAASLRLPSVPGLPPQGARLLPRPAAFMPEKAASFPPRFLRLCRNAPRLPAPALPSSFRPFTLFLPPEKAFFSHSAGLWGKNAFRHLPFF